MRQRCSEKGPHGPHPAPLGRVSVLPAFERAGLIIDDAVARLTSDDFEAVRCYPPPLRKKILGHVGLRDMRSITRSAATSLVRVLRGNDRKKRASLIHTLTIPFGGAFENHDVLSADECIRLLGSVDVADLLTEAPSLVEMLVNTRALSEGLIDLVLAEVYRHDLALSAVALALLTGSTERMGPDAAAAVRSAWQELLPLQPGLPEAPTLLPELRDVASAVLPGRASQNVPAGKGGVQTDSEPEPAVTESTEENGTPVVIDRPAEGGDSAPDHTSPIPVEALRTELELLHRTFQDAADAAERLRRAFTDAGRPLDEDIAVILRGVREFDGLRSRLESAHGPALGTTTEALLHAIDQLESADSRRRRILALAQVSGPSSLEGLLQEVREAAVAESPVLEILAELIRLADDLDAIDRTEELQERFRQEAPAEWWKLGVAALRGWLSVPDETDIAPSAPRNDAPPPEISQDDGSAGAAAPADAGSSEDSAHGGSTDEDPADEGGGGAAPPEDEPPAPTSPSAAEAHAGPADMDELAELDAFIADAVVQPVKSASTQPSKTSAADKQETIPPPDTETIRESGRLCVEPVPALSSASVSGAAESADTEEAGSPMALTGGMGLTGGAAEAEAAALRAGRFGLAAWLREAADRPRAEVNARRCAAISAETSEFAGRLSAAFTESAGNVTAKALGDDAPGQLLAWAAALRTSLIHPTPETVRLLDELSPVLSPYPGLTAYGEAFGGKARAGAYLVPGLSGRMHDASRAEGSREQASAAAVRFLEEGPSQKIKFALATDVWKTLIQDDSSGPGKLLAVTARDDTSRAHEVEQELDELRTGDAIDRLIDATAKARASRGGAGRIHSGARTKLIEKIEKALDLVADWVAAIHEAKSLQTDDSGVSWAVRHLDELRTTVSRYRPQVEDELAALETSSDPLVAAAAAGVSRLVRDTLRLLDGGPLSQPEPLITHLLNGDLLLSPTIGFDAEAFAPLAGPTLEDLLPLCRDGDRGWRAAFEERSRLGDHRGTRALLSALAQHDPGLHTEFRQRRDKLVDAARHERDNRIEDVQDRIAEWRRAGVLPEVTATRFSAMLQTLGSDERDDFDVITRELDELEREAARTRDEQITGGLAALAALSAEDSAVAAVRERIRIYIEDGDLTTAREFMVQAKNGNQLPEISAAVDHLERFFPHFPQAFENMSARLPGRQKNREGAEWLQRLKDALRIGQEVDEPELGGLLRQAELSISGIPRSRRGVAGEGLRLWHALSQGPKAAGNLRSVITAVLQVIGLEGEQGASREERDRLWITLDQVRTIGDPLLPAFGSRMSPSGDRLRLLLVWRSPGPQQVVEWLKDQPADQTVLVLYFGVLTVEQRRQLAAVSRRRPTPVAAFLDDAAISYLACLPGADWSTTVSLLAPFTATNPYAPTGDVPEEMFYGRLDQLQEVVRRAGSSFVYGGRQLGKSALLRKAERNIRKTDRNRVVISEVIQNIGKIESVAALWRTLADRLTQAEVLPHLPMPSTDPEEICRGVKEWIGSDPARQLLILLDEADEFLNADARDASFGNVITLRNLMNETDRRVKVVFAGLHQTARFESLSNQPLAHLGTPIAVGPLDPQDAYSLLTKPLEALGFRFSPRLGARVIAEANNAPALIQLFADALLTRLRRISAAHTALPYEITREDVDAVWRDNKLARGFRDRFEWTLNLDKRYKVIAYTVAFHALDEGNDGELTASQLRTECLEWWPHGFRDSTSDGFRGLLEECVNLGVLAADGERYRLRTPHILNLLGGADEVEAVLGQAETFERPEEFDAQSYRDAYKEHGERSPLTGSQVTRLLGHRNVLHLVAGSPALQVDRVAAALEEAASRHKQARTLRVGVDGLTFDGALQRAAQSSDHDIVIVDLAGQQPRRATTIARAAAKAISAPTKGTRALVLVAPPEHASEWLSVSREVDAGGDGPGALTGAAELIELQRFNQAAVRQWMHEVGLGFQDRASQDGLLRTTGGWPLLISKVVHVLTRGDADPEHALELCRTYLEEAPGEFVRSTGVLSGPALGAAWRTLVEFPDTAESAETLAGLLTSIGGDDADHPLSETNLQEEGFASAADLVEVLRVLGALVPQDDGTLRLEPVLLKATQRMGPSR
ncbi:hypothetical protein Ppa06_21910 [Planomonospora parontospora subsp. parontospora]|uniref:Novel STAND NTPase 1 domain-containing protein n=2 Tax=Planomonospora parontospora TaxID=58119 RepID=A0AA37F4F5_9ACTN|nr:hypothetical protein [Planomonospora parontospora]GGK65707.1 hypothetical protein GCM10010126_26320 [Planomonospora parontospora]GII08393.1 hypothetical protein Ppa06_21910 [Planomonospora parontospora subsp. parontospora]